MNATTRFLLVLLGVSVVVIPVILWSLFSGGKMDNPGNQNAEVPQLLPNANPASTTSAKLDESNLSTRSATSSGR